MKIRDAVLLNDFVMTDTQTAIVNIDLTDPITAILLRGTATNGATSNLKNWINDVITSIEIVDGSDILCSINLKQAQALHFQTPGAGVPILRPSEEPSGTQVEGAIILFGRYLYDKIYALDPTKFTNPQIKVTINLAEVRAVGATGFVTGTFSLNIIARIMEGLETRPLGFIMQKEIYSWAPAASGDKTIDLPRDYPYKSLLLGTYTKYSDIEITLPKLKLTLNEGKIIPFDIDTKDYWEENVQRYGKMQYRHDMFTYNGQLIDYILHHDPVLSLKSLSANRFFYVNYEWSGRAQIRVSDSAGLAVNAAEIVRVLVSGSSPHGTMIYTFGDGIDVDDYLSITDLKSIKLIATQGSASGNADIVLQQLRSY